MSDVLKTNNINFKTVTAHNGRYRFLKVPLNNLSGSSISLDQISSQLLEWKLPNVCYNLGKSYLSYNMSVPGTAAVFNWVANDTLELASSITFGTAGGLNLVDIQGVSNYLAVARKIDTDTHDYIQGDVTSGLMKADNNATNYLPVPFTPLAGNLYGLPASAQTVAQTTLEPLYLRSGGTTAATVINVKRTFPLKAITGTIFSMPQDQYFGDNMYLRILTNPANKISWNSVGSATPATTPTAIATSLSVSNLFLYLAIEKDQMICDSLMQKYQSGQLKYTIPFTYNFRFGTQGAGTQSLQVQLNSQYGKLLKRMLVATFPSSETLNAGFDHSNWSGSKISTYQTYLDSQPLQDAMVNCVQPSNGVLTEMDDYRENKAVIERSGVIMNPLSYQLNWFHCDEFATPSQDSSVPSSQIYAGLDLAQPKAWSMIMNTTAANYTHYVFAQFLRSVVISPSGPVYE